MVVVFKNTLKPNEVTNFRGAIINSIPPEMTLFHNHINDGYRFSYPLIQYKSIGGKAVLFCVGEGTTDIDSFFSSSEICLSIGNRKEIFNIDNVWANQWILQTWNDTFRYSIRRWLPLNSQNYKKFTSIEGLIERTKFLENILTGGILSMSKGLNIFLGSHVMCRIQSIQHSYQITYKGVKLQALDLLFDTNVYLPDYIGIGKGASTGFGTIKRIVRNHTTLPLLFVGGDISGIQKFIYNISSKKAMVSLKGRSTYLSQLTKDLCNGITSLPAINSSNYKEVIYCSGGKFYLIVEDSPKTRLSIEQFYNSCEKDLWDEHKGQLGIAISYVPFMMSQNGVIIDGVHYEKIGELWSRISSQFSILKNKKFHHLLTDSFESFFVVNPDGGNTRICAITGIEDNNCVLIEKDSDGDEIWVLPSVKRQVELGKQLRRQEDFKTLEEYASGSYVGVLRMDVDGLGTRFIRGFNSFDEYKAFSNKLTSFFEEELKVIQSNYKDYLNLVYAGGDDLFAVGQWNAILEFAEDVHNHFKECMKDENITISGGMAIVGEKFPIAKSAELSGKAEYDAKHYNNEQKNAFSFLGECVSWDSEFAYVKTTKDELVYQISINGVPSSLLHQLMRYSSISTGGKNISYKWHEAYFLTRMMGRLGKDNEKAKGFLNRLNKESLTHTPDKYRLLGLAARWAELQLRFNN